MQVDEEKIERTLALATLAGQRGERKMWIRARAAYKLVGLNFPGLTSELAGRCGVGVDMIERYAHAERQYQRVRGISVFCGDGRVRLSGQVRGRLSAAHYYVLYSLAQRYGISVAGQAVFLGQCIQSEGKRLSVADMRREVEAEYGSGRAVDWRVYYLPRLVRVAGLMLTFPDLPDDLAALLRAIAGRGNDV